MVIKYNNGCLFNQKHAYRFGWALTPNCLLCDKPDSGGHMLGECTHKAITKGRIQRHDTTVQKMAGLLKHSKQEQVRDCRLIMDAGTIAEEEVEQETLGSRVPAWILPKTPALERNLYRPDILVICSHTAESKTREDPIDKTLYIIEVGFGGDTFYTTTLQRKVEQHKQFTHALITAGWHVGGQINVIIGHGGTIYKQTISDLHNFLDIPIDPIRRCLQQIQVMTADTAAYLSRLKYQGGGP